MNLHLVNHIDNKIAQAADYVCRYMPLDINTDQAYESMLACSALNTERMIDAFKTAVGYLPPQLNHKNFSFAIGDGRIASIQARFTPTKEWPAFLIPDGTLTIDPKGKFAELLALPIRVATEWAQLTYVWEQLRANIDEPYVLAYLMPWIRECLADFDSSQVATAKGKMAELERRNADKELATVMQDWNVLFYPRLSKTLTGIARSGKTLFGQYHLLEAAYARGSLTQAPIYVQRTPSIIERWVIEHMVEVIEDWKHDKQQRDMRRLDDIAMKAAKRFDRLNKS